VFAYRFAFKHHNLSSGCRLAIFHSLPPSMHEPSLESLFGTTSAYFQLVFSTPSNLLFNEL